MTRRKATTKGFTPEWSDDAGEAAPGEWRIVDIQRRRRSVARLRIDGQEENIDGMGLPQAALFREGCGPRAPGSGAV
jgi:hypothetical protein